MIIIEYLEQGFADYFDEEIDKDYIAEMRIGDILKGKIQPDEDGNERAKLMIKDIDDDFIDVGCMDYDDQTAVYNNMFIPV